MKKRVKAAYTRSELEAAVKNNYSGAATLRELGMAINGSNHTALKRRIKDWNISNSHWAPYKHRKRLPVKPLSEILVENSTYKNLKGRLIKQELLPEHCSNEGCPTLNIRDWLGNPIPLQLDHINGVNNDNRIENLRLLCPICHVLTPTWGGRNQKHKRKKIVYLCPDCGAHIFKQSKRCRPCSITAGRTYSWPSASALAEEVAATSKAAVARRIGCSYNAVTKRMKNHPVE